MKVIPETRPTYYLSYFILRWKHKLNCCVNGRPESVSKDKKGHKWLLALKTSYKLAWNIWDFLTKTMLFETLPASTVPHHICHIYERLRNRSGSTNMPDYIMMSNFNLRIQKQAWFHCDVKLSQTCPIRSHQHAPFHKETILSFHLMHVYNSVRVRVRFFFRWMLPMEKPTSGI